jgi:hypothetical protein
MKPYIATTDAISQEREIDATHTLTYRAETIRAERTGTHARVSILMNRVALSWSTLNVEKDEERVRLTNSAYRTIEERMNGFSSIFSKSSMKHELDIFCSGLWDAYIAQSMPQEMSGSAEPHPPDFLLKPYMVRGAGTIIFAPPGRGKSFTLLAIGVSIDAGLQTLWPSTQAKVLFINLERSASSVADRLGNVNQALGLPRTRPLLTLNARGRSLQDVLPAAKKAVLEKGVGCVMLDSISRAGLGPLNDDTSANRAIDGLNALCDTWLALGHTPRKDESHLFGTIHFEAGADIVVRLHSQQEEGGPLGVGLEIVKENDIGRQPMSIIAFEFGPLGMCGVRKAHPHEFPDVEAGKGMTMKEAIKAHLLDVGKATATVIAEELGFHRTNVSHLLNHEKNTFRVVEKRGRDVLYGVVGHA